MGTFGDVRHGNHSWVKCRGDRSCGKATRHGSAAHQGRALSQRDGPACRHNMRRHRDLMLHGKDSAVGAMCCGSRALASVERCSDGVATIGPHVVATPRPHHCRELYGAEATINRAPWRRRRLRRCFVSWQSGGCSGVERAATGEPRQAKRRGDVVAALDETQAVGHNDPHIVLTWQLHRGRAAYHAGATLGIAHSGLGRYGATRHGDVG